MKPLYVALVAIVSALVGGLIGAILGGTVGGASGGIGGSILGARAGVCATTEVAKTQNLLTAEQADQLVNQTYTQLQDWTGDFGKDLVTTNNPDCQTVLDQIQQLGKK